MADDKSLEAARHRLGAALDRLEAIVLRRAAAHDALRTSTADALERLDRLIAQAEKR